jgi:hypothetical protein
VLFSSKADAKPSLVEISEFGFFGASAGVSGWFKNFFSHLCMVIIGNNIKRCLFLCIYYIINTINVNFRYKKYVKYFLQ